MALAPGTRDSAQVAWRGLSRTSQNIQPRVAITVLLAIDVERCVAILNIDLSSASSCAY